MARSQYHPSPRTTLSLADCWTRPRQKTTSRWRRWTRVQHSIPSSAAQVERQSRRSCDASGTLVELGLKKFGIVLWNVCFKGIVHHWSNVCYASVLSLGDNTIILNISRCLFFYSITISRTFSSYRDIGNSRLKKYIAKKKNAIVSQVRNSTETKLGQSFSAFASEKQKRTTSEVLCNANEFAIYCDACRRVHTCGNRLWSNRVWTKENKKWNRNICLPIYRGEKRKLILPKLNPYPFKYQERRKSFVSFRHVISNGIMYSMSQFGTIWRDQFIYMLSCWETLRPVLTKPGQILQKYFMDFECFFFGRFERFLSPGPIPRVWYSWVSSTGDGIRWYKLLQYPKKL